MASPHGLRWGSAALATHGCDHQPAQFETDSTLIVTSVTDRFRRSRRSTRCWRRGSRRSGFAISGLRTRHWRCRSDVTSVTFRDCGRGIGGAAVTLHPLHLLHRDHARYICYMRTRHSRCRSRGMRGVRGVKGERGVRRVCASSLCVVVAMWCSAQENAMWGAIPRWVRHQPSPPPLPSPPRHPLPPPSAGSQR